jgi:hypothetical protein
LAPSVKIENVWPVTHLDALPVIKGTYPIVSVWGYLTFVFFLGERIVNKDQIHKHSKVFCLSDDLFHAIVFFFVTGTLGPALAARMPIPFFMRRQGYFHHGNARQARTRAPVHLGRLPISSW